MSKGNHRGEVSQIVDRPQGGHLVDGVVSHDQDAAGQSLPVDGRLQSIGVIEPTALLDRLLHPFQAQARRTHLVRLRDATQEEMLEFRTLTPGMLRFLAACVQSKTTILISGGTGSGKTTMLNALSRFIPEEERIITIEDTAELQLQQRHVVKFETRPPNLNKEGGINQRQLLRTALRMRPDRIIVGECRGAEALDMLQAMNTGVEGSMSTVHANTPRDAFSRLETMVMMADLEIPTRVILQQLASAIRLVVQVSRLQDGTRKIVSISEVLGVKDDQVQLQEIFTFERMGVTDAGKVQGRFRATGTSPKILERLRISGIQLPPAIFEEVVDVNL